MKSSAEIKSVSDLTDENIAAMDKQQLINSVILSFDLEEFERIRIQALMQMRAGELNISTAVSRMISAYRKKMRRPRKRGL